jgi:effector-binding domain-containing protein
MIVLVIPTENYVYLKHTGAEEAIGKSFSSVQKWAKENNYHIDPLDFKIDITLGDEENSHDLYCKIV